MKQIYWMWSKVYKLSRFIGCGPKYTNEADLLKVAQSIQMKQIYWMWSKVYK